MMGLPDGWVCDVPGVTRNEQMTALGNGVVPQQAAAAIRAMLLSPACPTLLDAVSHKLRDAPETARTAAPRT